MPLHLPARVVVPALAVLLAAGCAEQPTQPHDLAPSLGKGGVDTDSRARWAWADMVTIDGLAVPAGIRGDGRLANGTPTATDSSVYQGDVCGVHAKIFFANASLSGSGDAIFAPDMNYSAKTSCGGIRRVLRFQLAEGGPHTELETFNNAMKIMFVPAEGGTIRMNFGLGVSGCEGARFHDFYDAGGGLATYEPNAGGPIARAVRVTRLDGGTGARKWRIESQAPHTAVCAVTVKSGMVNTNRTIELPFSVEVTEIPYAP